MRNNNAESNDRNERQAVFERAWVLAQDTLAGERPGHSEDDARIVQWRREEWHCWFRWRVCRKGFDWSKPASIGLLTLGFAALVYYGFATGRMFVTAGGVVAWFTVVNLGFFTYIGLTLPNPPLAVPGPFQPGLRIRAKMGLHPPGYERRKLARVWIRIPAAAGERPDWLFELAYSVLPEDFKELLKRQETWRIQHGNAPATDVVIETLPVTREQIDTGSHPLKIIAWKWDEQSMQAFKR